MLKTYRIIPLVFILFLFGFTLFTVSPVIAQQQWNPSMGMCHNSRPCMKMNQCGDECAVHVRESKGWVNPGDATAEQYENQNQAQKQIEEMLRRNEEIMKGFRQKIERNLPWDPSMGMRHPARPCMKNGLITPSKGCGPDNRASAIIARDPYDKEYIILKRAAPALEQACFRRCEGPTSTGWQRSTCKARCVAKRPNPRCKGGSFSGFYTTESSLRCLN